MPMLAETIDGVIGVDPHRDILAAAAVGPVGATHEKPRLVPMPGS